MRHSTVALLVVHLRLPFQLLLAPVFLWGWLIAGGRPSVSVAVAFIVFHVFLYGGATAYNSYYDRDVGPVGGLERPPPVSEALLPFAVAMKLVGLLLAWLVNPSFAVIYAMFAALSFAYSHPSIRLKSRTYGSLVVVGFGQGVLAFLGAWAATRGDLASAASLEGALGALAATLLIVALYPLTQLYQVEEDLARGDRTLAAVWGPRRCFVFALMSTLLGGSSMLVVLVRRFGVADALLVGCGLVIQLVAITWWAVRYEPEAVLGNYRHLMRLNTLTAGALALYLLARIAYA
ncbi:MAG: UbiA prenyltransferase family protein [Chloroflexi bacterium]|nr:UbiA prenyltransferase family protein [Chloroflexota bacterium]